jgi:hypothetical protein
MGVGNVGCCDNSSALKNNEISVQSVTYREGNEDFVFFSNTIQMPACTTEVQGFDTLKRMKKLKKLKSYYSLKLSIISPQKQQELFVKPTGLIDSVRNFKDGYVFFGSKYKLDQVIVNDFKIPTKDKYKSKSVEGRHFMVFYKLETESYWIKDLNKGPGVFIKLDYPLVMKDGMVVNIGNCFLQFNFKTRITSNPEMEIRKLGDEDYRV